MYEYKGVKLHWLGHDAFWIEAKGKNIFLDPYKISKTDLPSADIIITSHEHFDHCNADEINKLASDQTILIGPKITQDILTGKITRKKEVKELNPGEKIIVDDIEISAIPAYNTHRFREPGKPFHPKESGHIGVILNLDGVKIYHAGDTDKIEEMNDLKPTIALIPVSGTYVMDVPEAVEAAQAIKAEITIPMHVGRGIGELSFVDEFKKSLSELQVVTLELEED
ncbi:MAG: MBL fold metallo-hydrolase [Candidatus Heimdallarchaeaceae archaeon]